MAENIESRPFAELRQTRYRRVKFGVEKKVYQRLDDSGILLAAKIYEEEDFDGIPIDQDARSFSEFQACQLLRNTSLRQLIPQPYYLLTDEKNDVIGLALEWRGGGELGNYKGRVMRPTEFNFIKESCLALAIKGVRLDIDMYNVYNLIFNRSAEERFAFAEYRLDTTDQSLANYLTDVMEQLGSLSLFVNWDKLQNKP